MRADNTVLAHPYLHGEVVIAAVVEGDQRGHRLTIAFAGAAYDG